VLALTAHIAAYQQERRGWMPCRHYLEENLLYIAQEVNRAFPKLNWQPPEATYLAWIDLRPLNIDDRARCKKC
jgi:cystathionine beta-lyase